MENRTMRLRMIVKAVMIGLLLGVAEITKGDTQVTIGDLKYYITESTYTFMRSASVLGHKDGTSATGTLIIPETVAYEGVVYPVNAIVDAAFSGCHSLSGDLYIPNSVNRIGATAFQNCSGISRLNIGNAVTLIGSRAFFNCHFSEVYYNAINCFDFGYYIYPFEECYINQLIIGNNVERIPAYIFYNAMIYNIPVISNSVKSIGNNAFYCSPYYNYNTWYGNQPDGILYIGSWCLGYKGEQPSGNLSIQEGTKGIADAAFYSCPIEMASLPNSMLFIGNESFNGSSLTSINIPNSVTTIGESAFMGCDFTSIDLPNSLTTIGNYAFSGSRLESISIPNSVTIIQDGVFSGCQFLSTVNIHDFVTSIGENAFGGCNSLTEIDLNSVTTIGDNAFWYCNNLTEINLNSVTSIGMMAFGSCMGFTSFTIPNSVVSLRDGVFRECTNLTSVYVGSSVSSIEGRLFDGCPNLVQIVVDSENDTFDSRNDCNAIINTANNRLDVGCKTTIIPNSVTSIGYSAFLGCDGLTSIEIPNSVIEINSLAFTYCTGLTNITIPNTVSLIGEAAFACTGLTSIVIPNSVVSIESCAFQSCANLTSAIIGNSASFIGNQIFDDCRSLAYVNILNGTPPTLGFCGYDIDFPTLNADFAIYVPYESVDAYKMATNWSTYAEYIQPLSYKTIPGYNANNNHWQFIASPLLEGMTSETIETMLASTDYDLYQFNQSGEDGEWQNYKADTFNIVNGQGYLYASAEEVNIIFKGEFNEDETKEVGLEYDANTPSAGWNLVGNPFPCNAYINREYYVMNEDGTAINPVAVSALTPIPPCTGVMVKAEAEGETVVFTRAVP